MATRYAGQRPWEAQPQDAATLGENLTDGLVGFWNLREQTPVNLVTGELAVVQVLANAIVTPGSAGVGIRATDAAQKCLQLAASKHALVGASSTQVTIAILHQLQGGSERAFAFDSSRLVGGDAKDGWYWAPNTVGSVRQFRHGTTDYATAARSSDATPVLRIFSAGPAGFWWSENGVVQATSGTAASALSSTDAPFYLGGGGYDAIYSWPQHAYAIAVWRSAKPQSFAGDLGRNIWQLIAPQSSRAPVAAGGAPTSIACGVGAASAQGHGVGIAAHTVVSAGVGAATATGHQASIVSHTAINAGVGAATAAGHQAAITVGSSTSISCGTGAAAAQGHQVAISLGTAVACGTGAAAAAGHQVAIATRTVVATGVGAAGAQGLQANIALRTVIACGAGAASAAGAQVTIGVRTSIACGVGQAGATGHQAAITVGNGTAIGCGTGAATAQGHAATVGVGISIACTVGAAAAAGHQVAIAERTVISGNVAQATAQGLQAGIVLRTVVAAGVGGANARGYQATVTVGVITPDYPLCLTVEISAEMVLHVRTGNPVSTIDVLIQPDTRFKPRVLSC